LDRLHGMVSRLVEEAAERAEDAAETLERIRAAAAALAERPRPEPRAGATPRVRRRSARLTEPWFC
jgi:hypothetical protein